MLRKAVLATDLSSDWDDIVACAVELKAFGVTHAILTHVIVTKGLAGSHDAVLSEAQPKLEEQSRQLTSRGFEVTIETPPGSEASSINEVAQRHEASLIVVGSHGKSAWHEAVLGSVSSALLHHAHFPILLINVKRLMDGGKGGSCQLRTPELLRHVLFPTDFSQVAGDVPEHIERIAPSGIAELTVLHVLEVSEAYPPAIIAPAENAARGIIDSLARRFKESGIPKIHSRITHGQPVPAIMNCLQEEDFSLVVMGTQGKTLLSEILLGSVAYNISRLAPCPVLLIPRKSFQ
jgi:nucleotide-binding universal stress UspA family protein